MKYLTFLFIILILFNSVYSQNNCLSLIGGFPDLIGLKYERQIGNYHIGIKSGVFTYLYCRYIENIEAFSSSIYFCKNIHKWKNNSIEAYVFCSYFYGIIGAKNQYEEIRKDLFTIGPRLGICKIVKRRRLNRIKLRLNGGFNIPLTREYGSNGSVSNFQLNSKYVPSMSLSIGYIF